MCSSGDGCGRGATDHRPLHYIAAHEEETIGFVCVGGTFWAGDGCVDPRHTNQRTRVHTHDGTRPTHRVRTLPLQRSKTKLLSLLPTSYPKRAEHAALSTGQFLQETMWREGLPTCSKRAFFFAALMEMVPWAAWELYKRNVEGRAQ